MSICFDMNNLIYTFLFVFLLLTSCQKQNDIQTIGETEYYFNEQLSSITLDTDGSLLIGTETGDIITVKNNIRIPFDTGEDRIYKTESLLDESGDKFLWIAVRNSGIQKWKYLGVSKYEKVKAYEIDFKKERYSPYDFIVIKDTMYVASSQGLFSLNLRDNSQKKLSLLYPSMDFFAHRKGTPFIIHNLVSYKDSLLIGSTQDGLLWYNLATKEMDMMKKGSHIEHVSIYHDTIFALSGDSLLQLNPRDRQIKSSYKLKFNPKIYYQIQGIHYLMGADKLMLSNNLKDFYEFRLKRAVPVNGRNLIVSDSSNVFTYLLTEKSLFRISNNINVFRSNIPIKASCSNNTSIYYLTNQNELYVQDIDSNDAKWIYSFPQENQIQWMDIIDNDLYFYNLNNEYQRLSISNNWVKNSLIASPTTILKSDAKITAARLKSINRSPQAYLGIQDGAIVVDDMGNVDSIPSLSDYYLTSMFSHKGSEHLYISTLNNGVYYVTSNQEVFRVPQTDSLPFINDIIATDHHQSNLIILTNREIISQESQDTIHVKGYKKLLYANDTLFYVLPEFGIQKFVIHDNKIIDKGLFYEDIRFDKISSFAVGNKLVLISNVGALNLSMNNESHGEWVSFESVHNINVLEIFLLVLLVFVILLLVFLVVRKKQRSILDEIFNSINDLSKRLADIELYYGILDDSDNQEIGYLKGRVDGIDPKNENLKELKQELEKYSLQIGKLNRKIALRIHNKLEEQIAEIQAIEAFEKRILLNQSLQVSKDEDIESIKDQVRLNDEWLRKRLTLLESIAESKEKLKGCIEITGVNKNLQKEILQLEKELMHRPLEKCIEENEQLKIKIENINSPESTSIIKEYLDEVDSYLQQKIEADNNIDFIGQDIETIKQKIDSEDNLSILKQLHYLNHNYSLLKIIDDLRSNTDKYKAVYNRIVDENNEQINKKFEKELSSYITNQTAQITNAINDQIEKFYKLLLKTDKPVLFDVLKITNSEGQHARVLALLITNFKIKRTLIPGMLGVYGNLNPVISRLINDRIKGNREDLIDIQNNLNKKSLFVYFVLRLIE